MTEGSDALAAGRSKGRPGDAAAIAGLAATMAALDPQRSAWRNDILISTIIETLSRRGHLSSRELRTDLQSVWVSKSTTLVAIEAALLEASTAGLIHSSARPSGEVRWQVTADTKEQAKADQRRARRLLEDFKLQVGQRLTELLAEPVGDDRVGLLTRTLVAAMAAASERVFEGARSTGNPEHLTAVRYGLNRLTEDLRRQVSPAEQAEALVRLALAAADPRDPFGDELLRLIVSGQILHGLVARRDAVGDRSLAGTVLTLDTTFLVMSVEANDATRKAFDELLKVSADIGCRVVITAEVLAEWERQWELADDQEPDALAEKLPGSYDRLLASPILRGYVHEHGESGTKWRNFCRRHRGMEQRLRLADAEVVASDPDPIVRARVEAELLRLSAERPDTRGRRPAAAAVDAISAGLVAKYRQESPPLGGLPGAWFVVGRERMTAEAYANVVPDDPFPLSVTPQSWLMFVSAKMGADVSPVALAEMLSESVILDAFLTVVTGYPAEELVQMFDSLAPSELDDDLAVELVRATLDEQPVGVDLQVRAGELLQRRALWHSRTAAADVEAAEARTAAAETRAMEAEARAVVQNVAPSAQGTVVVDERGARRWRRRACVIGIVLGLIVAILTVKLVVTPTWAALSPAVVAVALMALFGWSFAESDERGAKFWSATAAAVGLTIASMIPAARSGDGGEPAPESSVVPQQPQVGPAIPSPRALAERRRGWDGGPTDSTRNLRGN